MKKNFLFGLFATAMLLLTTACQKENDLANGNEVMVNFEVSAPVIATRAYSDGETATNLQYAVYNSNKEQLTTMKFGEQTGVGTAEMDNLKAKVSMRLALGNTYYVLFWADAYAEGEPAPYTVNFLDKKLTVDYTGALSNDENRDAFYCWKEVTDEELRRGSVKIEMRRPFAQLNIGTGDTKEALASGVTVGETAVKVKAYQTMDFVEGTVSDPVEAGVQFDFAAKPVNQTFPVANYDYLAMNYLLVRADKEVVNEVVFEYTVAENNNIETRTFTSIPLRRNYRTNIYGNLLTQAVDFNVEIKPEYVNQENPEDVFVVSTDKELKAALAKDDEVIRITLADNVSLANMKIGGAETETIIIEGSGIVRSGNHTLTMSSTYMPKFETVNPNATLVLKNINLVGAREEGTWDIYDLTFNCNVILENAVSNTAIALTKANATASLKGVTINETHDYYAMWISAAGQHVSIDGLIINASQGRGIKIDEQYVDTPSKVTLDIKNAAFTTAKKAAIMVKSAAGADITLNNIDLEGVAADQVNAVWVDEDAIAYADKVIVKGGSLAIEENKIVDNVYRIVNVNDLKNLATADDNNFVGKTAILLADLDLNNEEWTPIPTFNGTFDGNGKTIKNLVVTGNNSTVGLFGNTYNGEIKNLTIENAKVSGRLNVGVVAGNPYTSKYTNITVKGLVQVNGMAYVGGVGGKNAYANWTNITVAVEPGSYVKANSVENGTAYRTYVGGVVGFNGEGTHSFTNITSNINVVGSTCDVGGMFGIAHYGNQFKNLTCSGNVEITNAQEPEDAEEIGGIAGVWHNGGHDVVFTNCEFTGEVTTNKVRTKVWYDNLIGKPYSKDGKGKLIIDGEDADAIRVANADAFIEALENGEDVIFTSDIKIDPAGMSNAYGTTGINVKNGQTIDGNDYTLDIKGAGGTWDSGISTTGGLIKDITVTGSFRGIFVNHNSDHAEKVILNNVTIDGTVYTISCDQGTGNDLEAVNSTFKGWTSYASTIGNVTFTDCNFGEGQGYAFCRPYAPTVFTNCDFEAGYTVDPEAAVTFVNCTFGGKALTTENIAKLVTSTGKVTVK